MLIDRILEDLQNKGFSVQESIFAAETLQSIREEILTAYHNNSLKEAGIGKGADLQKNIRGDQIFWLTQETLTDSQKIIWNFLEEFKTQINRTLFFGLKDFETHVTVYPKNTFYKKHIDQFRKNEFSLNEKVRKVSFILYLNDQWEKTDGGELKIYDPKNTDQLLQTVLPQFGRIVFFLSEEFPHEVTETQKERISMTGWFYT